MIMTKKIEAIIREEALDAVKDALHAIGIVGMNAYEVRGHGRQGGIELSWRGTSYHMDMIPKMVINIVLSDRNVDRTIEAIIQAARTGNEAIASRQISVRGDYSVTSHPTGFTG